MGWRERFRKRFLDSETGDWKETPDPSEIEEFMEEECYESEDWLDDYRN
jgi:hypothetical protein